MSPSGPGVPKGRGARSRRASLRDRDRGAWAAPRPVGNPGPRSGVIPQRSVAPPGGWPPTPLAIRAPRLYLPPHAPTRRPSPAGPMPDDLATSYHDAISSVDEIIEDARQGRMFILVDHEDRENEGDLVIPAQMATPEKINFMATHGRGLICLALPGERVDALGLPLMASQNSSRHETAFTVSIEAREGVSTGISAHDRALTVAVAIDASKGAQDIATPGHVFPLRARGTAACSCARATPRPRWTWRGSRA